MSLGVDKRAATGGKSRRRDEGIGTVLSKVVLRHAVWPTVHISWHDEIAFSTVSACYCSLCVLWASALCLSRFLEQARTNQMQTREGLCPRAFEMGMLEPSAHLIALIFVSPASQVGRVMDSSHTLPCNCLTSVWEQAVPQTTPRRRTWEYLMLVVNDLKHLTTWHQGKDPSLSVQRWSVTIILWAIRPHQDNNSNFNSDSAGGVQPI